MKKERPGLPEISEISGGPQSLRIIFNALIAMKTPAYGTFGTNVSLKIDRKEGFFVFPYGFEFVIIGELNFSAALPTGRQQASSNRLVCLLVRLGCFFEVNSFSLYSNHSHTIGSYTL